MLLCGLLGEGWKALDGLEFLGDDTKEGGREGRALLTFSCFCLRKIGTRVILWSVRASPLSLF